MTPELNLTEHFINMQVPNAAAKDVLMPEYNALATKWIAAIKGVWGPLHIRPLEEETE